MEKNILNRMHRLAGINNDIANESFNRLKNIFESVSFLNEITSNEAYEKFYKNLFDTKNTELDKEMYNKIIELDPTYIKTDNNDKIGEYTKWLLRKDNVEIIKKIKEEDLYKIKNDLTFFNKAKIKNKLKIDEKDINKYNIRKLEDFISGFEEEDSELMSKTDIEKEIKKDIEKYELKNWTIVIPKTEESACFYGKGTKWCTAATGYNNQFSNYNSRGKLYIIINKNDPSEKYQFHFEDKQFMDVKDRDIVLGEFLEENEELYIFFKDKIGEDIDFIICESCISRYETDCFDYYYSNKFTDDQKYDLLKAAFYADDNSGDGDYYAFSNALGYIEYPNLKKDFKDEFMWGLEASFRNEDDNENYNAKMFIDLIGGFNEDTVEDIIKSVDLKKPDEVEKLIEIAKDYNATKIVNDYLEENEPDLINYDVINELEKLKSKFNYDEYDKTYETNLAKIKIKGWDLKNGKLNIEYIPKDEKGKLIVDKKKVGNINYKNLVNYLQNKTIV